MKKEKVKEHLSRFKQHFKKFVQPGQSEDIENDISPPDSQSKLDLWKLPTPVKIRIFSNKSLNGIKDEEAALAVALSLSSIVDVANQQQSTDASLHKSFARLQQIPRMPQNAFRKLPQEYKTLASSMTYEEQLKKAELENRQIYDEKNLQEIQKEVTNYREEEHLGNNEKQLKKSKFQGEPPEKFIDPLTNRLMDEPVRLVYQIKSYSTKVYDKTSADKILKETNPRDPYSQELVTHYVKEVALKKELDHWMEEVTGTKNNQNQTTSLPKFSLYQNKNPENSQAGNNDIPQFRNLNI